MPKAKPDVALEDYRWCASMTERANHGWYTGDMESLQRWGQHATRESRTNPELELMFLLTKDRMHHSVGWWRNAEYEYCWHLSVSATDKTTKRRVWTPQSGLQSPKVDIPPDELRYWTFAFFAQHADKLWHEPGGTDPRLTPRERDQNKHMHHMRLFLDPETFKPFIPEGEVYHLTRWIDGLTPEKVDR